MKIDTLAIRHGWLEQYTNAENTGTAQLNGFYRGGFRMYITKGNSNEAGKFWYCFNALECHVCLLT